MTSKAMILSSISIVLAIIAIATAGYINTNQENSNLDGKISEVSADLSNKINKLKSDTETDINIISSELERVKITLGILESEIDANTHESIENLDRIKGLKEDIALLEKRVVELEVSQPDDDPDTGDGFNLITSSSDPSDIKFEFEQGEVVYITGKHDEKANMLIEVHSPNDDLVQKKTFFTSTSGTFTTVFITDSDTDVGTYEITITDTKSGEKDYTAFKLTSP